MGSNQTMEQIELRKKILDVDTKTWSETDKQKIIKHLKKYKFKVEFKMPNGKIRYAYTNDDPQLIEMFMKQLNAVILKVTEL